LKTINILFIEITLRAEVVDGIIVLMLSEN